MKDSRAPSSRAVFPLSALFVMTTACAVVTAFLAPVVHAVAEGQVGLPEVIVACVGSIFFTAALGGLVGLYHHRRGRGLLWGILTGGVLGALLGPAVLSPIDAVPSLVIMSLVGSLVLVAIATVFWQAAA